MEGETTGTLFADALSLLCVGAPTIGKTDPGPTL
jgi:hypothetical protein